MEDIQVKIKRASPEDKPTLHNLLQFYLYDFSVMIQTDVDRNGLFEYPYLDLYWTETTRHPFLIFVDGNLAGFALVREIAEESRPLRKSIAEFFIMRKYRRCGVGRQAAFQVFEMFPGIWEVHQIQENEPAHTFWCKVIREYTHGDFRENHNDDGPYQVFQTQTDPNSG